MDESVQKQIETHLSAQLGTPHWAWFGGTKTGPGWCKWCDERAPQSLDTCRFHHPDEGGTPRIKKVMSSR